MRWRRRRRSWARCCPASNLDPGTLALVSKKLDEVMDSKNQLIKALQYDVAKVSKAHNDLIRVYEAKLAEFGVPVDELGFRPLVTNVNTGPAGLVVGACSIVRFHSNDSSNQKNGKLARAAPS